MTICWFMASFYLLTNRIKGQEAAVMMLIPSQLDMKLD